MQDKPLIGLTLYDCIKDIVKGAKSLEHIKILIIGHTCRSEEDWEQAIQTGLKYYWVDLDENLVRATVMQLRNSGRIEQPCLTSPNHFPIVAHTRDDRSVWVTSENEIEWSDDHTQKRL